MHDLRRHIPHAHPRTLVQQRGSVEFIVFGMAVLVSTAVFAAKADRSKLSDFQIETLEYDGAMNLGTFKGHVLVVQGTTRFEGENAIARLTPSGTALSVTVTGKPVKFWEKLNNNEGIAYAEAKRVEYDNTKANLELFDKAMISTPDKVLRGDYVWSRGSTGGSTTQEI